MDDGRGRALRLIEGEVGGPVAALARGALAGLAVVYSTGLKAYLLPYRLGVRRRARLECAVISVGNLTVGGTGKTPITRLVCDLLRGSGMRVCVLTRGYRGAHEHDAAVVSTYTKVELSVRAAGDEAHLLACLLPGVPVIVGQDRRRTGRMALDRFQPDAIVLDDGMQFYQLHRDLDIVLVDALRPFHNGWTFPRGLLREPPSHLARAGAVIVSNVDKVPDAEAELVVSRVRRLAPRAPVFRARYSVTGLRGLGRSPARELGWLPGHTVATLCALGNPAAFEAQVAALGTAVVYSCRLADHDEPTMGDLRAAIEAAVSAGAEAILVTEKDAVKLPPLDRPLPFYVVEARQVLDDVASFGDLLLRAARPARIAGEHEVKS